ncbi:HAMP domain-containing sensor histidine kinase [Clostridium intestinale]|uniref:histidine kinase n=1 Tax=Clostridium intestinale DSM 6191 TaxID=1121320 RepID=A0A1M5ZJ08_9CLOT|nr:sensor histidine kinase [Clostridium intestinale]SHI24315.1 Signal transduction histidine kinase [Clostridium intestinale DSM 6191]
MAIKLKGSRGLRFLCSIILMISVILEFTLIPNFCGNYKSGEFTDTDEFKDTVESFTRNLAFSYNNFGKTIESQKFKELTNNEFLKKKDKQIEEYNKIKQDLDNVKKDLDSGELQSYPLGQSIDSDGYYQGGVSINEEQVYINSYDEGITILSKYYKKSDEDIKKQVLNEYTNMYNSYEELLTKSYNIQFVIYNGETGEIEKSNLDDLSEGYIKDRKVNAMAYISIDGSKPGNILENTEGLHAQKILERLDYGNFNFVKENKIKLLLMVPKKLYNYNDNLKYSYDGFNQEKSEQKKNLVFILTFLVLSLISAIYLYITKSVISKNIITRLYKKLWLEVKITLILIDALILFMLFDGFEYMIRYGSYGERLMYLIGTFISYVISVETYKTLVKEIDEKGLKNVIKETSLLYKFYLLMKETFIIKSVGFKISIFSIATIIFILFTALSLPILTSGGNGIFFLLFMIIYIIMYICSMGYFVFNFTGSFNKIVLGAHKISQGDLNYQIEGSSIAVLDVLAKDINNMRSGLGNAIQNEVKSERMKTELITNVSHDLKTPLTSIINYVDLIKKGDFTKEEIEDYIKIIDRKSQRLKVLIEDLFEASSAASGEMELNIEKLDIVALLKQSIAEFEEKIKISKLDFRINIPNEKVYVMVDGKRTWRIFENQISNILKYSLDNTRVYINLEESEDRIIIIFKNISAYEIDFNEDEITERFKRGDQSRHTEGSGLGLAISKGLTELQDGIFKIKVDGDLFKVEIQLKKA